MGDAAHTVNTDRPRGLARYIPVFAWLPAYQPQWLRADLIAGLSTAAIVIPSAMAHASIAGLPVEIGLYTAFVPMIVYGVLGTSRLLSVSTTSTSGILTGSAIALVVTQGGSERLASVSVTLAFLVGLFLFVASILKLGFLANFISDPVLTGFKAGLGVVVIVDQLPKLLGISISADSTLRKLGAIAQSLPQTHLPTLIFSILTVAALALLSKYWPKIPAPLGVAIAGIIASILLGLKGAGIALIGTIPQGFPPLTLPQFSLIPSLWINALGIALIIFTETIAAGRAFMRRTDPPIIPNQELLALGVSNGFGSLFSSMPAGGGTSQTAINNNSGGKTEASAFVTALTVLLAILILAPVIGQMPSATLGAIIIFSMVGMLNVAEFEAIYRIRRVEFWWALAALLGAVILGTLAGILIAVILSLISLLHFASTPKVYEVGRIPGTHIFRPLSPDHPDDEIFPGLLIIRPEGAMDFLNVSHIRDRVWEMIRKRQPQVIVIDGSAIPNIEYTALKGLATFDQTLRGQNIMLWMARLNPEALRMVRRSPAGKALEPDRLFYKVEEAVNRYLQENPIDRR